MEKKESFSVRLKKLIEIRGIKQIELSRKTGIDRSSITHYIKGDWEGKQDAVYKIAQAMHVNEAWLMGFDVPMDRLEFTTISNPHANAAPADHIPRGFSPLPKMVKKPLIGRIACGEPITAEENIEDYVDVPESCVCDFCLHCVGDSMIDAHITNGDIVYIRANMPIRNGQIYAVRIDDEATLKRVYYDEVNSTLTLVPANSAFTPHTYTGAELERIHIEGMAVGFTHWYK